MEGGQREATLSDFDTSYSVLRKLEREMVEVTEEDDRCCLRDRGLSKSLMVVGLFLSRETMAILEGEEAACSSLLPKFPGPATTRAAVG